MSAEQLTQLLTEPREVDVVAIERELIRLWKDASEVGAAPGSAPVMRACSLNLIVITNDRHRMGELAEIIGEVTLEHPARVFLVAAERSSARPYLDAWVSARCSLPVPGGKQVCCEEITLAAGGADVEKISSIITGLLVPDVPVIVLWKLPVRPDDTLLLALSWVANRVIIDSSDEDSPHGTLRFWGAFMSRSHGHVSFGDLAWTHITPWRSVIAGAFNPEEMRSLLSTIHGIEIRHSVTSRPDHAGFSQAILLGGWFAERLRWNVSNALADTAGGISNAVLQKADNEQPNAITLTLRRVEPRPGFPGGVESVGIASGGTLLEFAATRHARCIAVRTQTLEAAEEHLATVLSNRNEAELIAQELEMTMPDKGYEAVMSKVLQLLGT